jgi:hypothetical protein
MAGRHGDNVVWRNPGSTDNRGLSGNNLIAEQAK